MSSPPTTNAIAERDDRGHEDAEKKPSDVPSSDGQQVSSAEAIDAEPPSERQTVAGAKYSMFTTFEKRSIVLAAAVGAFFSPLSAQIYYPALDALSRDLHVSVTEVNLTVTTYMVSKQDRSFVRSFGNGTNPLYACVHARYLGSQLG